MGTNYRLIRYFLLLLLLSPCAFAQARQLSATDTLQVLNLLQKGHDQLAIEELDSAGFYYQKAGALSRKIGYHSGIASYIRYYLRVLDRRGMHKEGLALSLEAFKVSRHLSKQEQATAYNNAGHMSSSQGQFEAAADYYLKALKLATAYGNKSHQMKFSNNLAAIFGELKISNKCFEYAKKSYQIALELQDTMGMSSSLLNAGYAELMQKHYDSASTHFLEALKLSKTIEELDNVLVAYVNLGEVEMEQKNYPSALGYYQQGLHTLHYYPSPLNELHIYEGLARTYYQLDLIEEATHYLNKGIEIGQNIGNANILQKLYKLGADLYEKRRDPARALGFMKRYNMLKDSLFNAETQRNIHKMEIEYQTTQKEKEIAQQHLVIVRNNLELEKKNNLIYLSAAVLIALLLGLIIIYLLYRNRQKTNAEKLIAMERDNELKVLMANVAGEEKERSRLARELHDGVGGILSATKMHLSVLRNETDLLPFMPKFDQAASLLDSASKEVRTIAHNLSPDLLLKYELEEALANFCQSVSNDYLQVDFYALGEPLKLKTNFKFIIYRIVQELVNNILKHAKATHALVQLSHHEQILSLTIEDNGQGFDMRESKGIGLLNLRTRVKELNGQLNLESSPGHGTTVYLELDITPFLNKETPLTAA